MTIRHMIQKDSNFIIVAFYPKENAIDHYGFINKEIAYSCKDDTNSVVGIWHVKPKNQKI